MLLLCGGRQEGAGGGAVAAGVATQGQTWAIQRAVVTMGGKAQMRGRRTAASSAGTAPEQWQLLQRVALLLPGTQAYL